MCLPHWDIEAIQLSQPFRSDAGHDRSPVLCLAGARDQSALFEAIQQARNIRVACNHATGDLPAREAPGCAAEDPQNVVLCRRDICRLQHLRYPARQYVAGAQQFNVDDFGEAGG